MGSGNLTIRKDIKNSKESGNVARKMAKVCYLVKMVNVLEMGYGKMMNRSSIKFF